MSTATEDRELAPETASSNNGRPYEPVLAATRYDRITSWLMSMIMLFGVAAVALGVIWASNKQWIIRRAPKPVDMLDIIEDVAGGGTEDGVLGESLYAPGPESPEVSTAANPDDVISDAPAMEQTMTAVLSAVGAAVEVSDQLMMGSDIGSSALPGGSPKGKGKHRNLGKGPGDGGGVKRQERWEIAFDQGQSEGEYTKQLDYFGVELGTVVGRQMYIVGKLSFPRPTVRTLQNTTQEKRLYFSWRSGNRRQTDLNILQKAGVPLAGSPVVLQFYPQNTEQILAHLERDYAAERGKKDLRLIRKTKFAVKKEGAGYKFEIVRQEYFGDAPSK